MAKNKTISVQGVDIVLYEYNSNDFISLTDLARHRDAKHTDVIPKIRKGISITNLKCLLVKAMLVFQFSP